MSDKDDRKLVAQLLDYAACESDGLSFTLEYAAETIADYSTSYAKLQAENEVLKAKLIEDEWISVEDRLPDDESGYTVLVFANDILSSFVEKVSFTGEQWVLRGSVYPPIVTHWMPLPEPPKEISDEL